MVKLDGFVFLLQSDGKARSILAYFFSVSVGVILAEFGF
jgi:hypothetical protein